MQYFDSSHTMPSQALMRSCTNPSLEMIRGMNHAFCLSHLSSSTAPPKKKKKNLQSLRLHLKGPLHLQISHLGSSDSTPRLAHHEPPTPLTPPGRLTMAAQSARQAGKEREGERGREKGSERERENEAKRQGEREVSAAAAAGRPPVAPACYC